MEEMMKEEEEEDEDEENERERSSELVPIGGQEMMLLAWTISACPKVLFPKVEFCQKNTDFQYRSRRVSQR